MMRSDESGWMVIAKYDVPGRRGLWLRLLHEPKDDGTEPTIVAFELCAGREGDDAYVRFDIPYPPDPSNPEHVKLMSLLNVLEYARWHVEIFESESDAACSCAACVSIREELALDRKRSVGWI